MVAGRKLTAPILIGTLLATWIGSGDIFSVADLSYNHGFSSLIGSAGGLETISANVTPRAHPILGNMTWIKALGYLVPTLLLALGNGNMYQRFFSARDEKEAKKVVVGWVIGVIIIGISLQSMAVIGSSMFKGLSSNESGKILLLVAHDGLPEAVGCILIASVVAIIVSTANSFLKKKARPDTWLFKLITKCEPNFTYARVLLRVRALLRLHVPLRKP